MGTGPGPANRRSPGMARRRSRMALGSAQLDASASVAGTFAYTPAAGTVLHAGDNQTLSVVFTPTDKHDRERHDDDQRLAGDTDDHLDGPASITYGTALGSAQLDASASVAGTFAYSPARHGPPCRRQSDAVRTFTPTD